MTPVGAFAEIVLAHVARETRRRAAERIRSDPSTADAEAGALLAYGVIGDAPAALRWLASLDLPSSA